MDGKRAIKLDNTSLLNNSMAQCSWVVKSVMACNMFTKDCSGSVAVAVAVVAVVAVGVAVANRVRRYKLKVAMHVATVGSTVRASKVLTVVNLSVKDSSSVDVVVCAVKARFSAFAKAVTVNIGCFFGGGTGRPIFLGDRLFRC